MTLRSMPTDDERAVVDDGETPPKTQRHRPSLFLFAPALLAVGLLAAGCGSGSPPSAASSADSLISQGLSAESHGQNQRALQDFSEAVAKNPSAPIAYYDLGVIYQQQLNKPNQAASEFNKALLADPNYKPALYDLAILETSANPLQAINLYQQLLKLNPNDPNVLFNLGLLLYAHNQVAQGKADLNKAISIDPSLKSRVPAGVSL
jgi:tetratricopeptide (TPR) repeat protein